MGRKSTAAKLAEVVEPDRGLVIHQPQMVDVHQLDPVAYNPRKIAPRMFEALKASIRTYGFIEPVVAQKKRMAIVGGHQRVKAIKEICVEDAVQIPRIPAIVLDLSDHEAKKLNIKLNKVRADFDPRMLGELLISIREDEPQQWQAEVENMGFELLEADRFVHLIEPVDIPPGDDGDIGTFGRSVTLSVEFTDARLRDATRVVLVKKAETAKKKPGELIAELLGVRLS